MVKMISVMSSGGRRCPYTSPDQVLSHPLFLRLSDLTNRLCFRLQSSPMATENDNKNKKKKRTTMVERKRESEMKELMEIVLKRQSSPSSSSSPSPSPSPSSSSSSGGGDDDLNHDVKLTFLTVAKSFYYIATCDAISLHSHIAKVLFQRVN